MRPDPVAHPARAATRTGRALMIIVLASSFGASCGGSSQPKTEVLGVVEAERESTDVGLIEAVCITNTPTHEPC